MVKDDYESVLQDMRLQSGLLWPIPITLDVNETFIKNLKDADRIALRDPEGVLVAVLQVEEIFQPDRKKRQKAFLAHSMKSIQVYPIFCIKPILIILGVDYSVLSRPCITISGICAIHHLAFARNLNSGAGARSLPFKQGTPCIARTRN